MTQSSANAEQAAKLVEHGEHLCEFREKLCEALGRELVLRAALQSVVEWNDRNGGYGELPSIMRDAERALSMPERKTG